MKIRETAVAGTFYPATPEKLKNLISQLETEERPKLSQPLTEIFVLGGVVPHAGYKFSGNEAIHFFSLLGRTKSKFETVVILHPDHRGHGPAYATDINDAWKSPMGNFNLDRELISRAGIPENELSHRMEHSAEVMLPFLHYYLPYEIRILPISISQQTPAIARELAQKLFQAISETGRKVLVIASSDFCHFMKPETGYELDSESIEVILKLDSDSLYNRILEKNITICGYGPIMTLIEYSKLAYPNVKVKVLARGNSAKCTPMNKVVDYVTILFYLEND